MPKHLPALFISHGGGPLPLLGDQGHESLSRCLSRVATEMSIQRPQAICVVSAHWEESSVQISVGSDSLLYDYYGFPKPAYALKYKAKGAMREAVRAKELLEQASFGPVNIVKRGFDHGVFVPLKLMYPSADVPVFQISLLESMDPKTHVEIGKVLGQLRDEGILILGSGMSLHNMDVLMKAMGGRPEPESRDRCEAFHEWLKQACHNESAAKLLCEWETAPFARYCHPREEHFVPLLVCAGAANGDKGRFFWEDAIGA
eukprot:CAMPEP_0118948582 /NCGR_PEP_ID=MMETSP1169-20130426/48087_1 /TAXON_ID=36882 /ORGANISM="Pyramimonas obovata, Strain CCMP722" /LENGTH=258 /DNA_ID=CAMNT_0006895053 /DNA_START=8 /DNA_END=781 /DNA_ORIENTATION=+